MEPSFDQTLSLIYFWLKENKLFKTCTSLEQECGCSIKEPAGTCCSLDKVIQTYHAMTVLTSFFASSKHIVNSQSSIPAKRAPRKKREPLMPPGVWVCPEMENVLGIVYDRNSGIENISEDASSCPNFKGIDNNNRVEIQNVNSVPPSGTEVIKDVEMFTSDSEGDSDDEFQPSETVCKLLHDHVSLGTPANEATSKEAQSIISARTHNAHTTKEKAIIKQKMVTTGNSGTSKKTTENEKPVELVEINRKRKKSRLPDIADGSNGYDFVADKNKRGKSHDLASTYNGVHSSPEVQPAYTKKKKKHKFHTEDDDTPERTLPEKKRKLHVDGDMHNVVGNGIESSPDSEMKKKKHKSNIDGNDSCEISEMYKSALILKKKKKKFKIEAEKNENTTEMDTTVGKKQQIINSGHGNEILTNLGDMLKKKKKKKHMHTVNATP